MRFIGKFKESSNLSQEAIKAIYNSLKKRKLYSIFKMAYLPLEPLNDVQTLTLTLPQIPVHVKFKIGDNIFIYRPNEKGNYSSLPFFLRYKVINKILSESHRWYDEFGGIDEVQPSRILRYTTEDYFNEKVQNVKPPMKDARFNLLFGLGFAIIGIFTELMLCYWLIPTFLPVFFAFLLFSTALAGLSTLIFFKK